MAAEGCRALVVHDPGGGQTQHLLSLALFQLGRHAEAEVWLRRAGFRLSGADLVDVLVNLAATLLALGRHEEALASINRARVLNPGGARALSAMADILRDRLRPAEALAAGRQAAVLEPERDQTWTTVGNALQLAGRVREAIVAYERALAIAPSSVIAHGNRQFTLCFDPTTTDEILFTAARAWGKVIETALPPLPQTTPTRSDRIRIGYHSFEYFHRSALDDYFPPVLRSHDRSRFEVVLIADGGRHDRRTDELRGMADRWIDLAGLDLSAKVERLRSAELHIAACLTGYLPIQRLAFAPRVAPIQVALMNHVSTTGMTAFDFRITDEWLDPPGQTDRWNTERLVRLAHGYVPMTPPDHAPTVSVLPARRNGYVTFGSFNNLSKITPETLALWSRVLAALPASRLILKSRALDDPAMRARYRNLASESGIDPGRIDMIGLVAAEAAHLAAIAQADIALDPTPFAGGRTTVETLSMGVPVINLRSPMIMGRLGDSLLSRAGLGSLVATTADAYVETAVALARDLDGLERRRTELPGILRRSRLCDVAGYTRELEEAYMSMVAGTL